jgi:hypothetical protein
MELARTFRPTETVFILRDRAMKVLKGTEPCLREGVAFAKFGPRRGWKKMVCGNFRRINKVPVYADRKEKKMTAIFLKYA